MDGSSYAEITPFSEVLGTYQNHIFVFFPAAGITILSFLQFHVPPDHLTHKQEPRIKTQTMQNKCWYPQVAPVYFLSLLLCSWQLMREFQRKHEREHYMMIMQWEWDVEPTHQMCAPVESVCACVCAVSSLSSCQSGTSAGPPRLKRCRPRMQLEIREKSQLLSEKTANVSGGGIKPKQSLL